MPRKSNRLTAASRLAARQAIVQDEERRDAVAALLSTPLITAEGERAAHFRLVRLHADWLKEWFLRWPGWTLIVGPDIARLRKHVFPRRDITRALIDRGSGSERTRFTRRRYALLCLTLATLETEQRQTTIQQVASKTEVIARTNPDLQGAGFEFDTKQIAHRRELVAVMRFLQRQHVLLRTDGDDNGFIKGGDCLYRIQRSALTTVLCSVRGASTIDSKTMAHEELDAWINGLNETETPESPQAQNRELQHRLVRRLLDDPVMYLDELTPREYEYFNSQGERLTRELAKTTGMFVERRAEGVALLDSTGDWTDLGLPETGTRGHATLLLAEWFGAQLRNNSEVECRVTREATREVVGTLASKHKSRWRKHADTPEGIRQILSDALDMLQSLSLIEVRGNDIIPRPAVARYRLGEVRVATAKETSGLLWSEDGEAETTA